MKKVCQFFKDATFYLFSFGLILVEIYSFIGSDKIEVVKFISSLYVALAMISGLVSIILEMFIRKNEKERNN